MSTTARKGNGTARPRRVWFYLSPRRLRFLEQCRNWRVSVAGVPGMALGHIKASRSAVLEELLGYLEQEIGSMLQKAPPDPRQLTLDCSPPCGEHCNCEPTNRG